MPLHLLFTCNTSITVVKFVTLVEKQKETISGESSDRSLKKKLGEKCLSYFAVSYNISLLELYLLSFCLSVHMCCASAMMIYTMIISSFWLSHWFW